MNESLAWLVTAVGLFLLEILTPGVFFFACLGAGSLAAAVSAAFGVPVVWNWMIFCVVSVASIYFMRPLARRYFGDVKKKSNVDALVGRSAPVLEKVAPDSPGMLKIDGELWKISSDEIIEVGERAVVAAIEGTHLVVGKEKK